MDDTPRYYRQLPPKSGRAFWTPNAHGHKYGFEKSVPLGPHGPDAMKAAIDWNAKLDRARREYREGGAPQLPLWRAGTLGSFYERHFKHTDSWALMEPRTREDYHRAWPKIAAQFGDTLISRLTPDLSERFHVELHPAHRNPRDPKGKLKLSRNDAHRTLKVWRTLLSALVDYRLIAAPPPVGRVSNPAPKGRSHVWLADEVDQLARACGWAGLAGLSVAIRVGWDTMLAPVDVRTLPRAGWRCQRDPEGRITGGEVATARAKTDAAVFHAVTPATADLVEGYLAWLTGRGVKLRPDEPLFRRPDGAPYLKNNFEEHFRKARGALFGPEDTRVFLDFRRSGATAARMGGASREDLGRAMANTIDQSDALMSTYVVGASKRILEARAAGEPHMRAKFRKNAE
jgi:hypothetical protein